MGVIEARKGKFVVLTDVEYITLSDDKATPGPLFSSVNAKFKMFIFDPEVGYRVFDNPNKGSFVDVLGGIRLWHINTGLSFSPGILAGTEVEGSRTWVDGVFGLRARAALSEKFFVSGKFGLGAGGSDFTYQLFGAVGYNFNKNVALTIGYRDLDVKYDKNGFLYDTSQRGPIIGLDSSSRPAVERLLSQDRTDTEIGRVDIASNAKRHMHLLPDSALRFGDWNSFGMSRSRLDRGRDSQRARTLEPP